MNAMVEGRRAKARTVKCGARLHGVPDDLVMVSLAGQLARHVSPAWYACIMFSDGRGVCVGARDNVPEPPEHAISWISHMAILLNKGLHEGGHWIIAWSPAQEPVLIWRDGDGDIHVAVEIACKVEALDGFTAQAVMNRASEALTEGRARLRSLGLGAGQTRLLAQQMAASARH